MATTDEKKEGERVAPAPTEVEPAKEIPSSVKTEGDFKTEVELLALSAMRRVADRIAEIVSDQAADRPIIYATVPAASEAALYDAFDTQLDIITNSVENLITAWSAETQQEAQLAADPIAATTATLAAAATLVSYLKIDTTIKAVDVSLDDAALRSAVVGALVRRGLIVQTPMSEGPRQTAPAEPLLLDRLLHLMALAETATKLAGDDAPRKSAVEPLASRLKTLVDTFLTDTTLLQRLVAVEWARVQADKGALLLAANLAASGGTWSTRTSLWTNLFTGAAPKFSGGAAISFSLSDLASGETLVSDVLYAYIPANDFQVSIDATLPLDNLNEPWSRRPLSKSDISPADLTKEADDSTRPTADVAGTYNPKYGVTFEALTPAGFYSADPDNLKVKRSIRTNNPGALNITNWQRAFPGFVGKTQPDGSGNVTSIYRTPEHGIAAWYHLLTVRYGFGLNGKVRVGALAQRYAGVTSENAPAAKSYIAGWYRFSESTLSASSVVRLNEIDDVTRLAIAMFGHEIGAASPLKAGQVVFAVGSWRDGTLAPT